MSARLLLFGCLAPAAAQRCAVCFSGAARSFARPHVRRAAKARLVDALGCDVTDAFFYVALEESPLRHARRDWDDFAPAPNVAAERNARPVDAGFASSLREDVPRRCGLRYVLAGGRRPQSDAAKTIEDGRRRRSPRTRSD